MSNARLSQLASFTDAELRNELEQRRLRPVEQTPLYTCGACGAKVFYRGVFKPHFYEQQMAQALADHADCQPSIDGAGI